MTQASIPKEITKELKVIRKDMDYIKGHMISAEIPAPKVKKEQIPVSRFGARPNLKPFIRDE